MKNQLISIARHFLAPLLVSTATVLYAQSTLPPDKVLVRNSRAAVTYRDFEAELARIPQTERFEIQISRDKTSLMLENMLTNKTLAQEARVN